MAAPLVEVKGGARLRSTLKKAGADMADLKAANQKVGDLIAQESAPIAPRGTTGRLSASMRSAKQAGRARVLAGSKAVPYAGPIHWGWPARNIKPQPWISTTAVATQATWLPMYEQDLQSLCDSVKGA